MKNLPWKSSALITLLMAIAITLTTTKTRAEGVTENGFGLGIALGNPAGISASLPVGPNNAFDVLVGYEFTGKPNVTLLGDYVWHLRDLLSVDPGKASLYYGPGVRARIGEDPEIGLRVVLGIDYIFQDTPLQAFFEVCPGVNVLPRTNPFATVGLGARYYF